MNDALLSPARSGDREAFAALVEPHRRELLLHCYRLLGSMQDAEDAVQESLLAAWLGLAGFEGRSSLRNWLYRIATHRCLNQVRSASRRPRAERAMPAVATPPTGTNEVTWLQPFPDALIEDIPDPSPGPEARYEQREAVSLAFVRALQLLPPRQRAVLVLRDVLGYRSRETADLLDLTEDAVNGALKRARSTMAADPEATADRWETNAELLEQFVDAFMAGDIAGLVDLFTEDVWLRMPPLPMEYHGRDEAIAFLAGIERHTTGLDLMVPVRCNGQSAWGEYVADSGPGNLHLAGVLVVDVRDGRISSLTHFDTAVAPSLGLPRILPPASTTANRG